MRVSVCCTFSYAECISNVSRKQTAKLHTSGNKCDWTQLICSKTVTWSRLHWGGTRTELLSFRKLSEGWWLRLD